MNKKKFFVFAVVVLLFGTVTMAYASGYPMAAAGSYSGVDVIVVGKFHQPDFTYAEANQISLLLGDVISSLGLPAAVYTPQDLQSMGINDADYLDQLALTYYQSAGFEVYIFIDVTKVPAVMSALGESLRADFWISDSLYVFSIEIPVAYIEQ